MVATPAKPFFLPTHRGCSARKKIDSFAAAHGGDGHMETRVTIGALLIHVITTNPVFHLPEVPEASGRACIRRHHGGHFDRLIDL